MNKNIKKKVMYWCKIKKAFIEKKNVVVDYNALPHKTKKSNEEKSSKKKSSKKN